MSQILVLGGTSVLGQQIIERLKSEGHSVFQSSRTTNSDYCFDIGSTFSFTQTKFDWIIGLAWSQNPRTNITAEQNVMAYREVINFSETVGSRILFVSTLGTRARQQQSWHVIGKQNVESLLGSRDVIIRPASIVNARGEIVGSVSRNILLTQTISKFFGIRDYLLLATATMDTICNVITGVIDNSKYDFNGSEINIVENFNTLGRRSSLLGINFPNELVNNVLKTIAKLNISVFKDVYDKWLAISNLQEFLKIEKNKLFPHDI